MTESTVTAYKSPLHKMTQTTPTCLWNDSASISELKYSIEHGAVGATCNPVIVLGVLKKELQVWKDPHPRIDQGASHRNGRSNRLASGSRNLGSKPRDCSNRFFARIAARMAGFRSRRTHGCFAILKRSSSRQSNSANSLPI